MTEDRNVVYFARFCQLIYIFCTDEPQLVSSSTPPFKVAKRYFNDLVNADTKKSVVRPLQIPQSVKQILVNADPDTYRSVYSDVQPTTNTQKLSSSAPTTHSTQPTLRKYLKSYLSTSQTIQPSSSAPTVKPSSSKPKRTKTVPQTPQKRRRIAFRDESDTEDQVPSSEPVVCEAEKETSQKDSGIGGSRLLKRLRRMTEAAKEGDQESLISQDKEFATVISSPSTPSKEAVSEKANTPSVSLVDTGTSADIDVQNLVVPDVILLEAPTTTNPSTTPVIDAVQTPKLSTTPSLHQDVDAQTLEDTESVSSDAANVGDTGDAATNEDADAADLSVCYLQPMCAPNSTFPVTIRGASSVTVQQGCVQGLQFWCNSSSDTNDELYKVFRKGNSGREISEIIAVAGEAAKTVPKEKSDYTAEDIASIAKDAKVRHLLHSAIDNVMSNRVINCKTAKEIWDALETRCQGTDTIKKNRKTILTQEYEHFDSKTNESLNDLYDRFVKLLNDLSLVDKEYDLEDSNLKFLLALPECWDLKATTIRDNYNLDEIILDEIYGMLKTHELEMEQRSKRKGGKSRTVALKAEEESPKAASSRKDKGKALFIKSETESSSSESDDDLDSESLPETDADEEMVKLKFRKGKKFSRKGISSDKKNFRRSEGRGGKSDRGDYTNVKCYNCGEKGHTSPDCKKVKGDKGKALVTKQKSWTDTSDSESKENYALMANADKESAESSSEAAETKVPQTTYAFHTDDINELRRYLKIMFVSYRDQTLTWERLTSENLAFKKRNDFLEKELVMFHQTQKDRDDAFYVRDEVLKMNESLKTELEKEREIIRTWTNSGKTTQNLLHRTKSHGSQQIKV
ncbi:hypothetical protein AgCh_000555 [Apium graveolens]